MSISERLQISQYFSLKRMDIVAELVIEETILTEKSLSLKAKGGNTSYHQHILKSWLESLSLERVEKTE